MADFDTRKESLSGLMERRMPEIGVCVLFISNICVMKRDVGLEKGTEVYAGYE